MLRNGTAMTMTIVAPNTDPNFVRAAQLVADSWTSNGISTTVTAVPLATTTVDCNGAAYEALIYEPTYGPTPYRVFSRPFNFCGFTKSNEWANFSALANAGLANTNLVEATQQIRQAEVILANSGALNDLLVLPGYVAYSTAQFTGWTPALQNTHDFDVFYSTSGTGLVFGQNVLASVSPVSVTPPSSNTNNYTAIIIGVVIVVIAVVSLALFFRRKR